MAVSHFPKKEVIHMTNEMIYLLMLLIGKSDIISVTVNNSTVVIRIKK